MVGAAIARISGGPRRLRRGRQWPRRGSHGSGRALEGRLSLVLDAYGLAQGDTPDWTKPTLANVGAPGVLKVPEALFTEGDEEQLFGCRESGSLSRPTQGVQAPGEQGDLHSVGAHVVATSASRFVRSGRCCMPSGVASPLDLRLSTQLTMINGGRSRLFGLSGRSRVGFSWLAGSTAASPPPGPQPVVEPDRVRVPGRCLPLDLAEPQCTRFGHDVLHQQGPTFRPR